MKGGRYWRGPRFAAYWAAMASAMDIEGKTNFSSPAQKGGVAFDDMPGLKAGRDLGEMVSTVRDKHDGIVAAVKKLSKGWVEISFKLEKWMEPDMECVDVKPLHFNHRGQNGQAVYDWTCHVAGYHRGLDPGQTKKDKPKLVSFSGILLQ